MDSQAFKLSVILDTLAGGSHEFWITLAKSNLEDDMQAATQFYQNALIEIFASFD